MGRAEWKLDQTLAHDVLHLEWRATGRGRKVDDGMDFFISKDGMIRVQTVVHTVQPACPCRPRDLARAATRRRRRP